MDRGARQTFLHRLRESLGKGVDHIPLEFIDVEGLAPYAEGSTLLPIVRQAYPSSETVDDRLALLSRLRDGAGVRVITGPLGKDYWGLVSREVQIVIWPDGYDWKDRVTDPLEWGLIQAGARELYKSHAAKGKSPSARHRSIRKWVLGNRLAEQLSVQRAEPLVHEDVPFEVVEVDDGLERLRSTRGTVALDWEWHRGTQAPVGLAISTADTNLYLPVWGSDTDNHARGDEVQRSFAAYLKSGGQAVLHGGRADLGTQLPDDPIDLLLGGKYVADDTMVEAYLLGETVLGLKPLSKKYLGVDPIENDREWADESARFTARYSAAGDTRNTYDLHKALAGKLAELPGQQAVYETIERPLVPVIASMEKYGTPVSIPRVLEAYNEHVRIETGLVRSVAELYGRDLRSDTDTRRFITDFGFADPGTLDQRVISLNPHWCIDLIMEYRRTRTRRRNFLKRVLQRWVGAGRPKDFRVYPRFNQAGSMDESGPAAPRTGRLSSADPNLMNQPHAIRDIYVPPEGCVWWSYDYSGLELRIAAGLSQDPVMLGALSEGRDLHGEFREFIRVKTGKDVGRVPAKTGNFEQLYEGGANQLVRILAKQRAFISGEDAQAIVDSHHQLFNRYHDWGSERVAEARRTGYASTLYGRLRRITEYDSADPGTVAHGDRAAQNHPVQGTGADVVKQVMVKLAREVFPKYGAHMCIQVHDEIDGWMPETADVAGFHEEVQAVMNSYEINGLPLKVEGMAGAKNWSEAH